MVKTASFELSSNTRLFLHKPTLGLKRTLGLLLSALLFVFSSLLVFAQLSSGLAASTLRLQLLRRLLGGRCRAKQSCSRLRHHYRSAGPALHNRVLVDELVGYPRLA